MLLLVVVLVGQMMAAVDVGALGREINREGGRMVVLLCATAVVVQQLRAIAAAAAGRYHYERWRCAAGMSVQDRFIFAVAARAVVAGIADGALPGTTADDRYDGGSRSGGMEPLASDGRRRRKLLLANFGPIGGGGCGQVRGRTLRNQPRDQSRGRRARVAIDRR